MTLRPTGDPDASAPRGHAADPASSSAMEFGQLWLGVELPLRSTADGGRRTAISTEREGTYRPNWSVAVPDPHAQTGAPVLVANPTWVSPGESANAVLIPLHPPSWAEVAAGDLLYLYEGSRLCGQAEVVEVWTSHGPRAEDARAHARSWVANR
jgi:hypothetical protein